MGKTFGNIAFSEIEEDQSSLTGVVQTELVPLSSITLEETFQNLFPINEERVQDIMGLMQTNGLDKSQPLHVWKKTNGALVLIDGHTRLEAGKRLHLFEMPVFYHYFKTEEEAKFYALSLQLYRRNLSQEDMILVAQQFIGLAEKTGKTSNTAIATQLVEHLHIGISTAKKIVKAAQNEEAVQKVLNGESINKVYNDIQKAEMPVNDDFSTEEESDIERNIYETEDCAENDEQPEETPSEPLTATKNTKPSVSESKDRYFAKGCEFMLCYILSRISAGENLDEIKMAFSGDEGLSPSKLNAFYKDVMTSDYKNGIADVKSKLLHLEM